MTFKWWPFRRLVQLSVLLLIASPLFGLEFFSGNLSAGNLLGLEFADPLSFLQATLAARLFVPAFLGGAAAIAIFYFLTGGRSFCGWVCPVYLATELSDKLRLRLKTGERNFALTGNRWSLLAVLLVSPLVSLPVFEIVSPIGALSRAVTFKAWQPLALLAAILMVEVLVARRLWCRSLCPVGGFYAHLGRFSPLKVRLDRMCCNGCGECSRVCPVEEVLHPALRGEAARVTAGDCTRCLACIDICQPNALGIGYATVKRQKP